MKKQPKKVTAKGRSRIVKTMDSSSDDDTETTSRGRLNKSEWTSPRGNKLTNKGNSKNRIKSSSTSASDESHLVQKSVEGANKLKSSSTSSTGTEADSPIVTGLTQGVPLRDRVRQRLELEASIKEERKKEEQRKVVIPSAETSPLFTHLKPKAEKQLSEKISDARRLDHNKENVKARFSLTMKSFSESDDEDFNISVGTSSNNKNFQKEQCMTSPANRSENVNRISPNTSSNSAMNSTRKSPLLHKESKLLNASASCAMRKNVGEGAYVPRNTSAQERISREERIRLAKMKQEGFRKKHLAQQNQSQTSASVRGTEISFNLREGTVEPGLSRIND